MKKFLVQNAVLSVLILAGTVALLVFVTGYRPQQNVATMVQKVDGGLRIKTYPGDERIGVLLREVHLDQDDIKRELHVKFKDGTIDTIFYDPFGRIAKIVETKVATGEYQVFRYAPKETKLLSVQSFRKDKTLLRETKPYGDTGVQSTYYGEDGKTPVIVQKQTKKGYDVTVYAADGTTKQSVYSSKADGSSLLQLYDDKGVLCHEEVIEAVGNRPVTGYPGRGYYGYGYGGYGQTANTITGYRPDGSVWYKGGSSHPILVTEYQADGKTEARRISQEKQDQNQSGYGYGYPGGYYPGYPYPYGPQNLLVDKCDQAGKVVQKRTESADNTFAVSKEETLDGEGKVTSTKDYKAGELVDTEAKNIYELCNSRDKTKIQQYMNLQNDPNHLQFLMVAVGDIP